MSRLSTTQTPAAPAPAAARGRPRGRGGLAQAIVDSLGARIRSRALRPGDKLPTESQIVEEHGVSRTVVREAISRLQAAGLVETRHGIGTFVIRAKGGTGFRIGASDVATVDDVLSVLELRVSLEVEAASLAAQRRTPVQLAAMRRALEVLTAAIPAMGDTVSPDLKFHLLIAEATGNRYFVDILEHLGATLIPRTRIKASPAASEPLMEYLRRVNREHEEIFAAIERGDSESARAAMRLHLTNGRERVRRARQTPSGGDDVV